MISNRKGSLFAAAMTLAFGAAVALAQSEPDPIAEIEAALARGDGIAAEMAGKRLLAEGADRAALAGYIGEGELLQGDLRDAREWLGAGEFTPETAQRGFHALGRLEMAGGYFADAAAAFDKALAIGEPTPEIWVDIGRLRYASGQQLLARDAALRAVELGPQNPRALEFMGQLVRDSEGLRSGLIWFARGVVAAPGDLAVLKEYAATIGELGRAMDMLRITRAMI
jgi:tetratricopeptide (TPR) repeat protein